MPTESLCGECGAEIRTGSPGGLCTRCAFHLALDAGNESVISAEERVGRAELAPTVAASGPVAGPRLRAGDYELVEEIARGGMGVVWRARQVRLDRWVAVKMILAGQFASREQALRFRAEAEAVARLLHPNIVAIHETGEWDGQPFFSMDYIQGGDLTRLVRDGPLPALHAAGLLRTIAEAVHYAHEQGILHRDLKPSNILLDESGQPRITDFGLSRRLEKNSFLTITGQVLGSPDFLPPEQAGANLGRAGRQSDVYALGAILFFLLTGRPPFMAETVAGKLQAVLHSEPISPRILYASVPEDLATICLKCLNKEPARRYPTARALAEELNRFLAGEPIHARPTGRVEKTWRWCRRKPALACALGGIGLLLIAFGIGAPVALWRINAARKLAELNAYVATVHLAGEALEADDLSRADVLLRGIARARAQRGLRGWEWRHLTDQNRSDELSMLGRHDERIANLALTPDDRWFATLGEDGVVKLWGFQTCTLVSSWRAHASDARERPDLIRHGLAMAPDGRILVTSGPDGTVRIWDTATQRSRDTLWSWAEFCTGLAFSADGRWLGAVAWSGEVKVWTWRDGEAALAGGWKGPGGLFMDLSFAPDGRSLALGGMLSAVRRWDLSDVSQAHELSHHPGSGGPGVLLPDGRGMVTTPSGTHGLLYWDLGSSAQPQLWPGGSTMPIRIAASRDGRKVAAGYQDGRIVVFDVKGRIPPVTHVGHTSGVTGLAFTRDGLRLISTSADGTIRLWQAAAKRSAAQSLRHGSTVMAVEFSPDSTRLASVAREFRDEAGQLPEQCTLRLWRVQGLELEASASLGSGGGMTADIGFSPDGQWIAADTWSDSLTLFNRRNLTQVAHADGHAATFSGAGSDFICARTNHLVRRRSMALSEGHESVVGEMPGRVIRLVLSPDGTSAAACSEGEGGTRLFFWDIVRRQLRGIGTGHTGRIMNLAFSPDGRQLASVSLDGTLGIWDVVRRTLTAAIPAHSSGVSGVAFAPDGRTIATAGEDGVRLWNVATFHEVLRLRTESGVEGVAFSPNGEWLAAAASDGAVRLWHAPTWEAIAAEASPGPASSSGR